MNTNMQSPGRDGFVMEPVLRRMSAFAPLTANETLLIEGLGRRTEIIAAKATIQVEAATPVRPRYILKGWACRNRLLHDGRRQIFGLLLPGDGVGVCPEAGALALTTTVALTQVTVADASALLNEQTVREHPEIAVAQRLAARDDEARLIDHVVRLGRQTAYERLAHLILELHARLTMIGSVQEDGFEFPLTQEVLADVLGLSVVHVNRTLQQFRRERLIDLRSGQLRLLNPELLVAVSDFRALA
jgi:CRP-like cAMP-binding protein